MKEPVGGGEGIERARDKDKDGEMVEGADGEECDGF